MNNVNENDRIMRDEIFGPVLPLLDCDNEKAAIDFVNSRPKPLAVYIFSTDKKSIDRITRTTSSGGVCVNEVITHLSNPSMPFGGVGQSGMGAYHGKYSFDTFTHFKPVMEKSNLFDLNTRYAPYKEKLKLLKKIMR
jgi:aldehyde dehydrogenase (NAD+)